MKASFTIEGRLPGLNEIVASARRHRMKSAEQKKQATVGCRLFIRSARVPKFREPVRVSFAWFEASARRDPDNVTAGAKPILDALVAEGILKNDTRRWVHELVHRFPKPDPKRPRVEVEIETIEEKSPVSCELDRAGVTVKGPITPYDSQGVNVKETGIVSRK